MNKPRLDVIIPVKDRSTVRDCVARLRSEAAQAQGFSLGKILLCDGNSKAIDCQAQLAEVAQWENVERLACRSEEYTRGFNKGWLLNQGLAATTAPIVLISDVDILWNQETLNELAIAAVNHPSRLYYIRSVQESEPQHQASQRPRYGYRIEHQGRGYLVTIYAEPSSLAPVSHPSSTSQLRPGCGLVCAKRSLFQNIGGYRQSFRGWGWEDQDLLIRAQLLGYELGHLGWVTHLSHGDEQRNKFASQQSVQDSRDRNILHCLAELTPDNLQGDWSTTGFSPQLSSHPIRTQIPPELQALAQRKKSHGP